MAIARPKTKKQLKGFIGIVSFYYDMLPKEIRTIGTTIHLDIWQIQFYVNMRLGGSF